MKSIITPIKHISILILLLLAVTGCGGGMHYGGQDVPLKITVTDAKGGSVPATVYVVDNMTWSSNRKLTDDTQRRQKLEEIMSKEAGSLTPSVQKATSPASFTLQPYATVIFADWNGKLTEYGRPITPGRVMYDTKAGHDAPLTEITFQLRE